MEVLKLNSFKDYRLQKMKSDNIFIMRTDDKLINPKFAKRLIKQS